MAARNEAMQNTITRATLTVAPWVSRARGESDMAWRIRPRRPLRMTSVSAAASTANTTIT